jgi:hypothetical protein
MLCVAQTGRVNHSWILHLLDVHNTPGILKKPLIVCEIYHVYRSDRVHTFDRQMSRKFRWEIIEIIDAGYEACNNSIINRIKRN